MPYRQCWGQSPAKPCKPQAMPSGLGRGGLVLGLLPLGLPQVDLTLPEGASLQPDGTLRVVHQGPVQRFGPAPASLEAATQALRALLPQGTFRIADTGVWWLESANGAPLVVRPDWVAERGVPQPPLVHRFETDATGRVWLMQADGLRMLLHASLAEPGALLTLLTSGATLTKLAGPAHLVVGTSTITRQTGAATAGSDQCSGGKQHGPRKRAKRSLHPGWLHRMREKSSPMDAGNGADYGHAPCVRLRLPQCNQPRAAALPAYDHRNRPNKAMHSGKIAPPTPVSAHVGVIA